MRSFNPSSCPHMPACLTACLRAHACMHANAQAHPDAPRREFTAESVKGCRPSFVPTQDNHCDCGLFLLTFLEFFTYAAPHQGLFFDAVKSKKGPGEQPIPGARMPGFLRPGWFGTRNAGLLREHLRIACLELMLQQVRVYPAQ